MRKQIMCMTACLAVVLVAGCGSRSYNTDDVESIVEQAEGDTVTAVEPASEDTVTIVELKAPKVKEGVTEPGEDEIDVVFTWDAVEGADGYEIREESKFCTEETFRKPDNDLTSYTSQTTYICGAQDDFDFRIRVRSFRGEGDSREFSEWSEYAYGKTYEGTVNISDTDKKSGTATQEEADELFEKAIAGEIIVKAYYEDNTDCSFRIPELPHDPDDFECFEVGERVDLDNDGVKELIINGPYGGKYLDARDGEVFQLAEGEGTAGWLWHAEYNGETYICHVDNSHGGRETFLMDQYDGSGNIVESTSLTAEYWDSVEFDADSAICHFGDEEISVDRYLELRKEIFDY